jgi:hypothetical protein
VSTAPIPTLRRPAATLPVALAVVVLLSALLYWMATNIAHEHYRNVLIAAVLAQAFWVGVRWRTSVYVFMIYVVAEGFLVNYFWNVPELNLLKDVFVAALFVVLASRFVGRGVFPIPRTPWMLPFAAFAVVYCLQIFNPSLPNLLVGLVGIRATLLYALLMPVGFWFFESRERTIGFFAFLTLVSIPVALFGIYQYYVGPAWLTSLSPGFARAVYYAYGSSYSEETAYFRTFSTFVHTGGFGLYLTFMMLVCLALWSMQAFRRYRKLVAAIFLLLFLALMTTGSRGSFVWFFLSAGLLVVSERGARRLIPLIVLALLLLWGSLFVVGPGFVERFETLLDVDYVQQRNMPLLYWALVEALKSDWTGYGAGYASVASRHVGVTPLNGTVVENGLAKIRWEAGLPGLLLYALFIALFLVDCLRAPSRVRDPDLRWICSACAAFLFFSVVNVAMGTPFDSSPSNTYIWFFAGLLARAPFLPSAQAVREPEAPG